MIIYTGNACPNEHNVVQVVGEPDAVAWPLLRRSRIPSRCYLAVRVAAVLTFRRHRRHLIVHRGDVRVLGQVARVVRHHS